MRSAHPDRVVRSVCPYCAVGCQLDLHVKDDTVMRVTSPWIEEATPNQGSTCVKGRFGYDFPQHRDRLTTPLIRKGWMFQDGRWVWTGEWPRHREGPWLTIEEMGERKKPRPPLRQIGKPPLTGVPRLGDDDVRDRVATPAGWYSAFREATWEEALSLAAQEILRIRDQHGPRALGALSSAKCSNEDNYAFMRMVRGAFRTNSVDHCTRLCHSTSVSAMNRALNTAAASGSMREIEEATDVIFIAGANTTESHPVFGALIKRAVARGAKLIVADVRRVELAELADIHLQMLPGTDVALFNTMLHHIIDAGLTDPAFIAQRTREFDKVAAAVRPYTLQMGEKITGIPRETIRQAAEMYARGPRTSTLWAMGLTQHATGTDIVASLLNLLLACGMIGKWGAQMMPIRGQNNVQGASDVGSIPFAYTDYRPVSQPANRAEYARGVGSTRGNVVAGRRHDGDGDDPGRQPHSRSLHHGREPGDLRSEHRSRRGMGTGPRVPGGTGPLPYRDRPLGRRRAPRLLLCREDGHLREHRAADPAGSGRARAAGRGQTGPRYPDRPQQSSGSQNDLVGTRGCHGGDRISDSVVARRHLPGTERQWTPVSGPHPGIQRHCLPLCRCVPHRRREGHLRSGGVRRPRRAARRRISRSS